MVRAANRQTGVASFFRDLADSIEITGFTLHSFAAGQDDVHLLVRWTFRSITSGQQALMTMHHYWRIRDGKIDHFRGSENTEQTALVLTPDLTPRACSPAPRSDPYGQDRPSVSSGAPPGRRSHRMQIRTICAPQLMRYTPILTAPICANFDLVPLENRIG